MNSEITCQQCHCIFSSPVILTCCTSSLCSSCLSGISYKSDNDHKKLYNCPFCQKIIEETEIINENKFLEDFLYYNSNKRKKIEQECERCEKLTKYDDIMICNECSHKNLCKDCSDQIHSIGKFKSHERNPFLKRVHQQTTLVDNLTCEIHSKEKIEYLCPKDSKYVCSICVALHKQACKVSPISLKFK